MGVPELLKFVASAPGSMSRVRDGALEFDYIFVDATNLIQTSSTGSFLTLLKRPGLKVRRSVVLCFDSHRDRSGTAREHRAVLTTHAMDVSAQQLARDVLAVGLGVPISVSGREVDGEADFKVLHLLRTLVTANKKASVLIVSEDSDVVAGSLCGPFVSTTFVATSLHDVTKELCILSMDVVMKWLSSGVAQPEEQAAAAAAAAAATATTTGQLTAPPAPTTTSSGGEAAAVKRTRFDDDDSDDEKAGGVESDPTVIARRTPAERRRFLVGCDLTFLFLLVKGSGYLLPSVKGATRIDMNTFWSLYMTQQTPMLSVAGDTMSVSCAALRTVLAGAHLTDTTARPPTDDEIQGAEKYLEAALRVLMRYIVAMQGGALAAELIDSRSDPILEIPSPNTFSAMLNRREVFSLSLSAAFPVNRKTPSRPVEASLVDARTGRSTRLDGARVPSSTSLGAIIDAWVVNRAIAPAVVSDKAMSYSFELRRMIKETTASTAATRDQILAAAGLSTSYAVDSTPLQRKKLRMEKKK